MQDDLANTAVKNDKPSAKSKWAKRAGIGAFLFFLGKGLVWLGLAAAGAYYALN